MSAPAYRSAGVDLDHDEGFVDRVKEIARGTFRAEVLSNIGGFAGLFKAPERYKEPIFVASTDGVGTKLKLAALLSRFDVAGIDCVGMVVNDLVVQGAEPLIFLDYLALGEQDDELAEQALRGVAEGCRRAGCALLGGETATMPGFYPKGELELVGFGVGVVERSRVIDGTAIRAGDTLLGLASNGVHSNGFSLVRRILDEGIAAGRFDLRSTPPELNTSLAGALLAPTRIYVKPILNLLLLAETSDFRFLGDRGWRRRGRDAPGVQLRDRDGVGRRQRRGGGHQPAPARHGRAPSRHRGGRAQGRRRAADRPRGVVRRLSLRGSAGSWRARRWDVLILGTALPGWFAAARLGSLGLRVLVVEEDAPNRETPLLNEPFFASCLSGGPLDEALKACGITPVDRRGLDSDPVSYQVLLDEARIDVGHPNATADDLVAYGVAKPDEARALVRELESVGRAQAQALLAGNWVRAGSRRGAGRPTAVPALPEPPPILRALPPGLEWFVEAQIAAQSLTGEGAGEDADARLLSASFGGGVYFGRPGTSLLGLLQKRVERVHGEVRRLSGAFELVEVGGHPGVALRSSGEAWLGRALVINTPIPCIVRALAGWENPVPRGFEDAPLGPQQITALFRADAELFPEALAARAILATREAPVPLALSLFPSSPPGATLLAARGTFPAEARPEDTADDIEKAVRAFFPFCEGRLERVAHSRASVWDSPLQLDRAPGKPFWPGTTELRLPGKLPIFALPRGRLGSLGVEGDAILGWRAADAVAPRP
jgi:phosphoribosylaminoimidazole synthetase